METTSDTASSASDTPSVFVSYARDDRETAVALVRGLEAQGFRVWWDGLLEGGRAFADRIEEALKTADAVVVLWSARSVRSHWVRDEAAHGRDRGRLIPASVDGTEPPLGFRQIQAVDLSGWDGQPDAPEFAGLAQCIRDLAAAPEAQRAFFAAPIRPRPGVSRRNALLIGGASVAAVGAGLVAWPMLSGTAALSNSIVVLPFRNVSGNESETYFSDGRSEELRATLSRNNQLAVAAQTSSDKFRDGKLDARAVAAKLGVAFLLEGSVRRAAQTLRISARIIDGKTGLDRWSQSFDRSIADVLAVQSEIATAVADALLGSVLFADESPARRVGGTENAAAFDAYVRGVALYREASGEESDRGALAAFDEAVKLDPLYAAAHAARSRALTVIANTYGPHSELKNYYRRSIEAAQQAVRIAPDLAEGHSALGFVLFNGELNAQSARAPYQRSFELGFGNADILSAYANFAARIGEFAEGRKAIARATQLDPLNATVFRNAGLLEFAARDFDAAVTQFRTALSINPKSGIIRSALGDIELLNGNAEAARALYEQESDGINRLRGLAIANMRLGRKAEAEANMAELLREHGDTSDYQQAQVLAQWGREEDALAAIETAYAHGDAGLVRSRNDPLLDPIRKTVRFAKVQRAIGFV